MKIATFILALCHSCIMACTHNPAVEMGSAHHEPIIPETVDDIAALQIETHPGIYSFLEKSDQLKGKRIAVVANHTSLINGVHLVDTLVASGALVVLVFAPEHGFRGDKADGALVANELDSRTGIPVVSLYGKSKKPAASSLKDVDLVVFDIQDVGARFYTYISTLHYVMEACAENGVAVTVLDRPNPNIHYIDGPILEPEFKSFVGMHPVPVVYGMTIGEYAQMINGEGWLEGGLKANLNVVPCTGYNRTVKYMVTVSPSPNLQTMESIYLYPSLCFFEGTVVSVGRGTEAPFAIFGEPTNTKGDFTFTPKAIPGVSDNPPHKNVICRGYDMRGVIEKDVLPYRLDISHLIRMYGETADQSKFFLKSGFFDLLAGTRQLRMDVIAGKTEDEIREGWKQGLISFKLKREPYLIYKSE
jgi:uncharacterized protein YbbC (DUF1343 family)